MIQPSIKGIPSSFDLSGFERYLISQNEVMKTIEDLPENLRRELDELIAWKNAALIAMEFETVKSTATRCLNTQRFELYNTAIIAGQKLKMGQVKTNPRKELNAQKQMNAWKKKTTKLISEYVHPSEGRRLRETAPKSITPDPIANLCDEVRVYSEFLNTLEKRITDRSTETDELLKDRVRLGHIIQRSIPHLNSQPLKFSQAALVSLIKCINREMKAERAVSPGEDLTLEAKTLNAFLSWIRDADEIIDNLNVALLELFAFKNSQLSREDLWIRYRFFVRTYIYEYARFRPTFRRFLKKLWVLGHIDQATRLGTADNWELLNETMTGARNQISHVDMPILDEERSAFLVTTLAPLTNRFVVREDTSQLVQPSHEMAELAEKMATEFGRSGRNAVAFLQVFSEERYEDIKTRFPDWNSFKTSATP
jgi:hypothetical protein